MEDVATFVRDNWSAEGAEVLSVGKLSLTVNLPYEFRQIDDALDELTYVHDVSTDLLLTETGATLRVRRGRPGMRQRASTAVGDETSASITRGGVLPVCNGKTFGVVSGIVVVIIALLLALVMSRPPSSA